MYRVTGYSWGGEHIMATVQDMLGLVRHTKVIDLYIGGALPTRQPEEEEPGREE